MYINFNGAGLKHLNEKNRQVFSSLYDSTPEEFIESYKQDWIPDDLTNKYVVAVEQRCEAPKDPLDGFYCFEILSIYIPRIDQIAELMYCGHIAFVIVKNKNGEALNLFYKDDQCVPQTLDEWYQEEIAWQIEDDFILKDGVIPTKEQVIELIKIVIKGFVQNPELNLNINEEDLIILQGL